MNIFRVEYDRIGGSSGVVDVVSKFDSQPETLLHRDGLLAFSGSVKRAAALKRVAELVDADFFSFDFYGAGLNALTIV